MKRYSRKQKLLLLISCLLVGISVYFGTYSIFASDMTEWQKAQTINFEKGTGSTKFKSHIDAATAGGMAFCIAAAGITTYVRLREMKRLRDASARRVENGDSGK